MLDKISLYDNDSIRQWDEFVESHPNGTPYHLSHWLRTIHRTYSFKPLMYVEKNSNGEIIGVFPCFLIKTFFTNARLVSIPFSDYGGPLFKEDIRVEKILKKTIEKHGRSTKYIEIRNSLKENSNFIYCNYYKRHILNLQADLTEIKKGINKKTTLYSIRKAKKAGVEIKEENSWYGMEEFYRLNILNRKKHGVPSQPREFFKNLFDYTISKGYGFILLAVHNSKTIAASLFLKSGKRLHYKYSASDPEYLRKVSPNHLLTWHAIKKGVMEGYRSLDFGRTSPKNQGLIRYKKMWGLKEFDLPYSYHPKVSGASSTEENDLRYRMLTNLWKALPSGILEKVGPIIYKHLG